nr:hypothetical protein [Pseudodesulfovibrio sp.]
MPSKNVKSEPPSSNEPPSSKGLPNSLEPGKGEEVLGQDQADYSSREVVPLTSIKHIRLAIDLLSREKTSFLVSKAALAKNHGIGPSTVNRAFKRFKTDGFLSSSLGESPEGRVCSLITILDAGIYGDLLRQEERADPYAYRGKTRPPHVNHSVHMDERVHMGVVVHMN